MPFIQTCKQQLTDKGWFFYFSILASVALLVIGVLNLGTIGNSVSQALSYTRPFMMGAFYAYLLLVPMKMLERFLRRRQHQFWREQAHLLSFWLTVLGLLILLAVLMNFLIPAIIGSVNALLRNLPVYQQEITQALANLERDYGLLSSFGLIEQNTAVDLARMLEKINWPAMRDSFQGIFGITASITNFFLSWTMAILILWDRQKIAQFIKNLIQAITPHELTGTVLHYIRRANNIFELYLSSTLFDAVIVGLAASVVLALVRSPYVVILALVVGVTNLVPIIGAILGVVVVSLVVWLTQDVSAGLWTLLGLTVIQQLDGNVIKTLLYGKSLKLGPLLTILSISLGGAIWGVAGMFFAAPVCALLVTALNDFVAWRKKCP